MNRPSCVKCDLSSGLSPKVRLFGKYYRTSDSTWVQRFRCSGCGFSFSRATFQLGCRQKKRRKNRSVVALLCSGVSQRRTAKLLKLHRTTVVRIFRIEAARAEFNLRKANLMHAKATAVQFDDLETFEHTKFKPLSVTLAVEEKTRRILGLEVSRMAASGLLAARSRARYGKRPDDRRKARERLLRRIAGLLDENVTIKSDQNPYYPELIHSVIPRATHVTFKGRKGAISGQGELKKIGFDPLFSLNHTCAMLRANVNRLFRRTWCTTKRKDCLYGHLVLYADFHNRMLLKRRPVLQHASRPV